MNTDRVHMTDRSRTDLVIRNDEGPVEEGLTYSEALAAVADRYTSEDEVWIDVPDDDDDDYAEDEQDPDDEES